jgi:hypothetical protein
MGIYLNPDASAYRGIANGRIFIDKSSLIGRLNFSIGDKGSLLCVTMPSRFGKTYLALMVSAYYTKGDDSSDVFSKLDASNSPDYEKHLNKHNVIRLDIAELCDPMGLKDAGAIALSEVKKEMEKAYPDVDFSDCPTLAKLLLRAYGATGERFVFVIDEWDYLLRTYPDEPEVADRYISFLRSLFKNSSLKQVIELCYMTGIMPMKRYGTMSALNEFNEYTMLGPDELAPYFGFSEGEVKKVAAQSGTSISLSELKEWYDGYRLEGVGEVYCPNSVVQACRRNFCRDYFAGTAAVSAITMGLKNSFISLEEESSILLSGGSVPLDPSTFSSDLSRLDTKDKGLTALVHAGFLRYDSTMESVTIPNREVALRFYSAVKEIGFSGGLSDLLQRSRDLLDRTLRGDESFVANTFDEFHARLASLFDKTNEAALSVLASVAYADAVRRYFPLKEPNLGKGRADIAFIPLRRGELPALVIELKVDDCVESAIAQIKAKEYYKPLEDYYGDVLLVEINFDKKTSKHVCKIGRITK